MVPHAVGSDWPEAHSADGVRFLAGAIFLVVADTLARTVFSPIELPVELSRP